MIAVSPKAGRFHTQIGWLDSWHAFSFGEHYDPERMGFRALRVLNDDTVQPGQGFSPHPHRDMEILSYVLDGGLQHKDSLGTGSVIRPGEVQRMSAGSGVVHSEFNASKTDPVHFLQIWLVPEARGIEPGYEQKRFPAEERRGRLRLVASRDGDRGAVTVHQDVLVYAGLFDSGEQTSFELKPGRHAYVHVARGELELNGQKLTGGDAAAVSEETRLELVGRAAAEVLVFDLA